MESKRQVARPAAEGERAPILTVEDVKMHYGTGSGWLGLGRSPVVRAVDGVSFQLFRGETLGIVGESGCGKSTLARLACHLIEPTGGQVIFDGQSLSGRSKRKLRTMRQRVQMVFQDPFASLNPRRTVFQIVEEPLIVHKLGDRAERERRVGELLERVSLSSSHWKRYPHEFSGGQRQRIVIARALSVSPELVICDEPVSALDVSVQAQIVNILKDLQRDLKLSYLFISHDLSIVKHMCDRVAVMYLGKIVEIAENEKIFSAPAHPYTKALISSILVPDPEAKPRRIMLKGSVPSPLNPPTGCHFHTRCPAVQHGDRIGLCSTKMPELQEVSPGHFSACHFAADVRTEQMH